jgi:hypothetical protein
VLSIIFTSLRLLYIIMSYDHSNFVTELNEFDRSKIRESRNLNISICLFRPRSTSRPLGRRVTHHPERRPLLSCSAHCAPSASLSPNGRNPGNRTEPILMCREAALIRPVESGWRAAAAARARPLPELVWVEACGAVTHGIDRGAEVAMAILVHRIEPTAIRL